MANVPKRRKHCNWRRKWAVTSWIINFILPHFRWIFGFGNPVTLWLWVTMLNVTCRWSSDSASVHEENEPLHDSELYKFCCILLSNFLGLTFRDQRWGHALVLPCLNHKNKASSGSSWAIQQIYFLYGSILQLDVANIHGVWTCSSGWQTVKCTLW